MKAWQLKVHFITDIPFPMEPYCRPMDARPVESTRQRGDVTCQLCLDKLTQTKRSRQHVRKEPG
jgi:hypothetical protein